MWFAIGFISGGATTFGLLLWRALKGSADKDRARHEAGLRMAREATALALARSHLQTIAERHEAEPMAAKIALRSLNSIRKTLGEPDPLDDIITQLGRSKGPIQ